MSTDITIVDTQAGNLFSLRAALERIGKTVTIAQAPEQIKGDALVIPGQGRFGTVMNNLSRNDWLDTLNNWKKNNKTILGICVGMQIMFEGSDEDPNTSGLGWFNGRVEKLSFPKHPMVGWAPISTEIFPKGTPYFVNSYAVRESNQCVATTRYGETFCAAVRQDNVTGFQFHPEKSSQYGAQLLSTVLNS